MSKMSAKDLTALIGIERPLVQGPFGGGLSSARLTAEISNRGGLGSFGVEHLTADGIEKAARDIRALTDKPFNLNLWVNVYDPGGLEIDEAEFERLWTLFEPSYRELGVDKPDRPRRFHEAFEDQIDALIAAEPRVFSFVFGIPPPAVLAECRRKGIVTMGSATTLAEGLALEEAGVDTIVATGFEAGGHRVSFLERAEDSLVGTFVLTQLIASRVKVPVVSAGGIMDGRGVRAALALGASGALAGSAFLATEESNASPAHRAALLDGAGRTVLTRAHSGRLGRSIANRWSDQQPAAFAPYPIQNWFTAKLKPAAAKAGRLDLVSIWGGQIAPNLKHRSAAAVMADLSEGLDR